MGATDVKSRIGADVVADLTANGNEALLQCDSSDDSSWCCDANRPELSGGQACCDTSATRFGISKGQQIFMGGSASSAAVSESSSSVQSSDDLHSSTRLPSSSANDNKFTSPPQSSNAVVTFSTARSSRVTSGPNPPGTSIVLITSIVSGDGGSVITSVLTPAPAPAQTSATSAQKSTKGPPVATIVGGVIGGVLGLLLLFLLGCFLVWRRRRRRRERPSPPSPNRHLEPMYKDPQSPMSPYNAKSSELEGSSPDLAAATANKRWHRDTFLSASEADSSPVGSPNPNSRGVSGIVEKNAVELPAGDDAAVKERNRLSELPARSWSGKGR